MTWQTFIHSPSNKTELWLRFHGGQRGDWTRPCGQRVKSLAEAKKMGWEPRSVHCGNPQ